MLVRCESKIAFLDDIYRFFYNYMVFYGYNSYKGEGNMKKLLIILVCFTLMVGCSSNTKEESNTNSNSQETSAELSNQETPKEYTYSDIKSSSKQFWDMYLEELDKLSDAEIHGTTDDGEEKDENYFNASEKCSEKIEGNINIPRGQKVIVTGYVSGVIEIPEDAFFVRKGCGNIGFHLKGNPEDDPFIGLSCKTNNKEFLDLKDNTPVKIEAIFLKPGMSGDNSDLYECKIIESGEPEDVDVIREATAVAN